MKSFKILAFLISFSVVLSMFGCGDKTVQTKDPKKVELIDKYDKIRADPLKAMPQRPAGVPQRKPIPGQAPRPAQ